MLAAPPDWSALEIYQNTITREEFERLLTTIFTTGDAWRSCIEIDENEARIQTGNSPTDPVFHLRFAQTESTAPRHWRTATELPPTTPDTTARRPENRHRPRPHRRRVGENGRTLVRRRHRQARPGRRHDPPRRQAPQAPPRSPRCHRFPRPRQSRTRHPDPPGSLAFACQRSPPPDRRKNSPSACFYRTAEIRARADLVNHTLKPDLVLCLHFNAEAWGDPTNPTLIDRTHLHLLLNGAYTDEEVLLADQRFALLQKLLQRTHQEEALVGATVADTFAEISGLPPYALPTGIQNRPPARPPVPLGAQPPRQPPLRLPRHFHGTLRHEFHHRPRPHPGRRLRGTPGNFRQTPALHLPRIRRRALPKGSSALLPCTEILPRVDPPGYVAFHQTTAAISGKKSDSRHPSSHLPRSSLVGRNHPSLAMISRLLLLLSLATPVFAQDGGQLSPSTAPPAMVPTEKEPPVALSRRSPEVLG